MWQKIKPFVYYIGLSLGVGAVAALLTRGNMNIYDNITEPPLSPPMWLFPVVWSILYVLMGISLYLILSSKKCTKSAIYYFALQLFFNFCWPIAFFNFQLFWFAFVWLLVLIYLVIRMLIEYYKINRVAFWLQIPYLIWIVFASILNLSIAILN